MRDCRERECGIRIPLPDFAQCFQQETFQTTSPNVSGLALHQWSYRYVRNVARFAAIRHERKKINTPKEICSASAALRSHRKQLLVSSVTPFKIDKNKNHNHSTDNDKVQNLGDERRSIYKDPRQDLSRRNNSYTRYPRKCFTQIYRALYGDAMLELIRMSSNMADGNQQKHLLPSLLQKREFTPRGTHKH